MANQKEISDEVEWRIRVGEEQPETLVPQESLVRRVWFCLKDVFTRLGLKVGRFLKTAWELGADDPRKVIHCLKVGIALTFVSLFYYMRPLYDGVGGNAMWAVMTVVVVFENTAGATLSKSLNRVFGTFLAGVLAIGVHWIALQSGEEFEPIIIGASVFLLASAATFSRFIPSVKRRFDYGTLIFILTFSLVAVSGYRVDKLFELAHQRMSTIAIGTSLCILVSILICPIWAGQELFTLITKNMDKLACSLDSSVAKYFDHKLQTGEEAQQELLGYKCVLTSKATEESLANFASWEPAHGRFNFRHPWKQYLKIGASMRSCAYCIEALNGCVNSDNQASESIKKHLSDTCLRISSTSSSVMKELAKSIKTMRRSSTLDILVEDMTIAVQDLQNDLKSLPRLFDTSEPISEPENPENKKFMEIITVVTFASLLTEIASRIESLVEAVKELAKLAEFKVAQTNWKSAQDKQKDAENV